MIQRLSCISSSCGMLSPLMARIQWLHTGKHSSVNLPSFPSCTNILCSKQSDSSTLYTRHMQRQLHMSSNMKVRPNPSKSAKSYKFLDFHTYINNVEDDFAMNSLEWEKLEKEILEESPRFAAGLDYSIMKSLNTKPDLSVSFMNYIRTKREPNLAVQTRFLINCVEKHEELVLAEFELMKKTGYLNSVVYCKSYSTIQCIAKTREWRQCVEMLESITNHSPKERHCINACSQILKTALKHRDYDIFFKVWYKYVQVPFEDKQHADAVSSKLYESWKEGDIPADVLMELLKLEELPLHEGQVRQFEQYCNSEWSESACAKLTRVTRNSSHCMSCGKKIPEQESIEKSIFRKMSKDFVEKVMIADNIFMKTDPIEFKTFQEFMRNQERPYDYVVDGLNIHHGRNQQQVVFAKLRELSKAGSRILITWKGNANMKQFTSYADVFSTTNKSYDDCYMLLAAFLSGPECYIVTNDDLRDHIALVDPDLRRYFLQWRQQRRVYHDAGELVYPPLYQWTAHESNSAWHIPYRKDINFEKHKNSHSQAEVLAKTFLCVLKRNYMPSSELALVRASRQAALRKTEINNVN